MLRVHSIVVLTLFVSGCTSDHSSTAEVMETSDVVDEPRDVVDVVEVDVVDMAEVDLIECRDDAECASGVCDESIGTCLGASCSDAVKNGDESDVDCGGTFCDRCLEGQLCGVPTDCSSRVCVENLCQSPTCVDDTRNQDESDVDCGGMACDPCEDGGVCINDTDCVNGVCRVGVCQTVSCSDGVINGDESDVDCGGATCSPCAHGQSCVVTSDCLSGFCDQDSCNTTASCKELNETVPSTADGVYWIDPDGASGPEVPFDAYCDMTTDGGGWTLTLKTHSGSMLTYAAPQWESTALLNETDLVPNVDPSAGSEAKFEAYNSVRGTVMRFEWCDPADHDMLYERMATRCSDVACTALEVFQGDEDRVLGNTGGCATAMTDAPGYRDDLMRFGRGNQFFGINRANEFRFGFASNDEPNNASGVKIGVGVSTVALTWVSHDDCDGSGGTCGCYGAPTIPCHPTLTPCIPINLSPNAVNLWVR